MFNFGEENFEVQIGDRIAQLIIEKITPTFIEIVEELEKTERGDGRLGSTGLNEVISK